MQLILDAMTPKGAFWGGLGEQVFELYGSLAIREQAIRKHLGGVLDPKDKF